MAAIELHVTRADSNYTMIDLPIGCQYLTLKVVQHVACEPNIMCGLLCVHPVCHMVVQVELDALGLATHKVLIQHGMGPQHYV
jgi:hypothetical protein